MTNRTDVKSELDKVAILSAIYVLWKSVVLFNLDATCSPTVVLHPLPKIIRKSCISMGFPDAGTNCRNSCENTHAEVRSGPRATLSILLPDERRRCRLRSCR